MSASELFFGIYANKTIFTHLHLHLHLHYITLYLSAFPLFRVHSLFLLFCTINT